MCGIGAIFGPRIKDGRSIILRSLGAVMHRGNSLFETAESADCVLGANRLEIVDRENARQPQSNEDGTISVVFNGEIFNHGELREALRKEGHVFRTGCDTEVLAHLYEQHGPGMVKKLDSEMFAFFIHDRGRNSFFAARDPYGVKPMYYSLDKSGNWHFASEIKQLSQFDEIDKIMEFPPGHCMLDSKLVRYHDPPAGMVPQDTGRVISTIRRLFDDAVRKRVDTDLPVAVFFSGGLDSAAVLATARKYHEDVTAITVGLPGSSDMLSAKRYCAESGICHVCLTSPPADEMARKVRQVVRITETFEPAVVRHGALSLLVAELARKRGFRVVLCGEGADELFAGYRYFENYPGFLLPHVLQKGIRNMSRVVFQRVDRTSMFHTVEVRLPFFDTKFADYAMRLPAGLKLRNSGGRRTAKWILRQAMKDRLPGYIADREKEQFTYGAGYPDEEKEDSISKIAGRKLSDSEFARLKRENPSWGIDSKEVAYYFSFFEKNNYTKAEYACNRPSYGLFPLSIMARILSSPVRTRPS